MDGIRIIVGLGNSGESYAGNRHNAGFWFVDQLAELHGANFSPQKKFSGATCQITTEQGKILLFKPEPFINLSGKPLASLTQFHKVSIAQTLVVHDEIDFDNAKLRLKLGGGTGGHNGLADIVQYLGANFWRLRIGVGHPGAQSKVVSYVLSDPDVNERVDIDLGIQKALKLVPLLQAGEFELAMNQLHSEERAEKKIKESTRENTEKSTGESGDGV